MCFKPSIRDNLSIFVYYGVSGSGKTHKVYEDNHLTQIYKVKYGNNGIWFDGYDNK